MLSAQHLLAYRHQRGKLVVCGDWIACLPRPIGEFFPHGQGVGMLLPGHALPDRQQRIEVVTGPVGVSGTPGPVGEAEPSD